jgi:hypothetical protein
MVAKSQDTTQFARVANPDGTSPIGVAPVGDGLAPLCDEHGRLIVSSGGATLNFALDRTANVDGTSPTGAQVAGTYQPSLCDAHGRQLSASLVANANGANPGGAGAPNTLKMPLLDAHGRQIITNLTANADGSNPGGASAPNTMQIPLLDAHGRLITVPYVNGQILSSALTRVDSAAVVLWQLVSAASCKLFQAFGSQASGALLWLHLFNLAAGPPGAAVPYMSALPVQNNGMWSHSFPEGLSFSTGLVIAYSTVLTGYTAPGTGGWISALIR